MTISLLDVIQTVESAGRSSALRFEVELFDRLKSGEMNERELQLVGIIRQANSCSEDTALSIMSHSWGRFQMLGLTLYDLGFSSSIFQYWYNEGSAQDAIGGSFRGSMNWVTRFLTTRCGLSLTQINDASWLDVEQAGIASDVLRFATRYNGPGQPEIYAARLRAAYQAFAKGSTS